MKKIMKSFGHNIIIFILVLFASLYYISFLYSNVDKTESDIIIEKKYINDLDADIEMLSSYIKGRKSNTPEEVSLKIAEEVIKQSHASNIPAELIVGIIEIESMWDIYAKSSAGAIGLMQILIEDGVEILPEKAYNISYNIEKGIAILKSKLNKSNGDISLALKYYVGGDDEYHNKVYSYFGRFILYKMTHSQKNILSKISLNKIEKGI